jgi:hypothetical protein
MAITNYHRYLSSLIDHFVNLRYAEYADSTENT